MHFISQSSCGLRAKLRGRYRFPLCPSHPHTHRLFPLSKFHIRGAHFLQSVNLHQSLSPKAHGLHSGSHLVFHILWVLMIYNDMQYHTEQFHFPKSPLWSGQSSLSLNNHRCFSCPQRLSFPGCHIAGMIQYVAFSDWFPSLYYLRLRFLHAFPRLKAHDLLALSV